MLNDIRQLFRPLDFLKIRNHRRGLYQLGLPAIFTVAIVGLQFFGKNNLDILADNSFITKIIPFLQTLMPLTMTALAIVATFPSEIMEQKMSGNPKPKLQRKVRGAFIEEELTRRRYVCLLFGYLTLLNTTLLLINAVLPDIIRITLMIPLINQHLIHCIILIIFAFLLGNLLANMLLGLFYLSDRIHRQD